MTRSRRLSRTASRISFKVLRLIGPDQASAIIVRRSFFARSDFKQAVRCEKSCSRLDKRRDPLTASADPWFIALWYSFSAGWSSLVARWAHNPKVGGSNPPPATNLLNQLQALLLRCRLHFHRNFHKSFQKWS